ncbi:hypothetical protein GN956_G15627 [Arapaima gigas]
MSVRDSPTAPFRSINISMGRARKSLRASGSLLSWGVPEGSPPNRAGLLQASHRQVLVLYNPYKFILKFKGSAGCPATVWLTDSDFRCQSRARAMPRATRR